MNAVGQMMIDTLKRMGSMQLAAEQVGISATDFRQKMIRDLENLGQPTEHLRVRDSIAVINQYLDRPYTKVRQRINNPYNIAGVAICHVHNRLVVRNPNNIEGTLVGVYDRNSHTDDMRDDLYWYVKNHMEAEQ